MKTIVITTCKECPFIVFAAAGRKPHCNNPLLASTKPYAENKPIDNVTFAIPAFCPLP